MTEISPCGRDDILIPVISSISEKSRTFPLEITPFDRNFFHFRFFNEKQKGLYTDFQYEALLIYRHYTGIAISCV